MHVGNIVPLGGETLYSSMFLPTRLVPYTPQYVLASQTNALVFNARLHATYTLLKCLIPVLLIASQ